MQNLYIGLGLVRSGDNVRQHSVLAMAAMVAGDIGGDVPTFEIVLKLNARDFDVVGKKLLTDEKFQERCKAGATAAEAIQQFEGWLRVAVREALGAKTVTLVVNDLVDYAFLCDMYAVARMPFGFDFSVDLSSHFQGVVGVSPEFATHDHIVRHLESPDPIPYVSAVQRAAFSAGAHHALLEWRTTRVTYDATKGGPAAMTTPMKGAVQYRAPRAMTLYGMPAVKPQALPEAPAATSGSDPRIRASATPTVVMPSVLATSASAPAQPAAKPAPKALQPTGVIPAQPAAAPVPVMIGAMCDGDLRPSQDPSEGQKVAAAQLRVRVSDPGQRGGSYSSREDSSDRVAVIPTPAPRQRVTEVAGSGRRMRDASAVQTVGSRRRGSGAAEEVQADRSKDPRAQGALSVPPPAMTATGK
jgi:hypothetical protein